MLGLNLIHVSKRGHRAIFVKAVFDESVNMINKLIVLIISVRIIFPEL